MIWIDWLIVILPMAALVAIALYARRFARDAASFLAAGRVAGRYVISVGDMMSWLSVIILVAGCEQTYQTGFGLSFWNNILTPISLVLALTGFCSYRWRQTRCLSKGQFIELRYGSKFFRMLTAAISTFSEMITNALGPAIAANFFIYYLGLPHKVMIGGINLPCYAIIVAVCLTLAMLPTAAFAAEPASQTADFTGAAEGGAEAALALLNAAKWSNADRAFLSDFRDDRRFCDSEAVVECRHHPVAMVAGAWRELHQPV